MQNRLCHYEVSGDNDARVEYLPGWKPADSLLTPAVNRRRHSEYSYHSGKELAQARYDTGDAFYESVNIFFAIS